MEAGLKVAGVVLVLFGVLFIFDAVHIFRFDHPFVTWHMRWGKNAAWAIRGGMLLLGLTLIFLTPSGDRR
ncbi:MAG TPA: hypothetical protein RMH85_16180 [Polyangiaceae bacterium LLY-WYZ-15_(1-7)]|nr:hypothetical protein [Myxococcales bacterium]MAT29809.1 hypothetical protein [Sandaracinus sp.]HJK92148.1 hypothetical protein [Polyangiaceae bacterium LLY-WYZ-15_(1-7)]MBJ71100.1 hypothetical protein [Sandaracinus sp.]HJL01189.1 hypothetical protein [Polyangiaceae bacterium LLY-WYZ-15_(1-7)]